jgi:amino acid adenylation domain-containing protein
MNSTFSIARSLTAAEREPLIATYLQAQTARIAGVTTPEIDREQPLSHLGFDSLMAVELRTQLLADFEVDIPLQAILEDVNIVHLASQINAQLETSSSRPAIEKLNSPSPQSTGSANHRDRFPLSQGQWGLWFLYRLNPTSAAYNLAFTARLRSRLNQAALQRAVQTLIDRHPSLRTTYGQAEAEPFQEIHATQPLAFTQIDASGWSEATLRQRAIASYQQPFNLETGPVLRLTLFTQAPEAHVLLLAIHHIAVDGVSFGILLTELRSLYAAFAAGRDLDLAVAAPRYVDFVVWQRELVQSAMGEGLWRYWEEQLRQVPTLLLPLAKSQTTSQPEPGASLNFELSAVLTAQLRTLSRATGASLYVILLTAFQVLLYRYTGQEDIVVGTPANGRTEPQFAQTVGFFVNMIALRTNLAGNPPFTELLLRVRSTVLDAIAHQAYPAPLLIERLGRNRDLKAPGLFRAAFNLLNLPKLASDFELSVANSLDRPISWGDLCLEPFEIPQQEGQNDLVFDVLETPDRLVGILRYSTALFESSTIQQIATHFQTLLTSMVAQPNQPINCLSLLTEAEQRQLHHWATPTAIYPTHLCAHHLFEAQAERTPHATALVDGDRALTYVQLNQRSNQLAHRLQALGVTVETRVGICLTRSLNLVVAMLAVLKAGGAYVPLDSNYPVERLDTMLADAAVAVLITESALLEQFKAFAGHRVCLDSEADLAPFLPLHPPDRRSDQNPVSLVTPANLAYLVYTSGSTGKAKGVMVEHRSLVNAYFAWADAYDLAAADSHLQMASFAFDVFAGDVLRALGSGAKLVLCPSEHLLEPEALYRLLQAATITVAEFGPAVVRPLVRYLQQTNQRLDFLRVLIVGSDAFYVPEYLALRQLCHDQTRVINSYGVSEATIDSSYFETEAAELTGDGMVPIGRPFPNTQLLVLNAALQPVPIGVAGELFIGGIGLARGYVNLPELTQAQFIHLEPWGRLYRTGDRVCYRPDGNLEYLGRTDQQVKLRGFRVELGEIEATLLQAAAVWQSVVTVRTDADGIQSLVAYVVPEAGQTLAIAELREFLKQKLPSPLLPSAIVVLDKLPLNANGKVDRRALPLPDWFQRPLTVGFVAPRTAIERQLAQLWCDLLKLDRVGIQDNFFELGGHSLLATQVIAQVRARLQVDLPLREFLADPTIAHLSNWIESSYQHRLTPTLIPVAERQGNLPLSFGQEGLWFLHQLDGLGAAYNLPLHLRLTGELNLAVLEHSLKVLIQRHEILRMRCVIDGSQPRLIILPEEPLRLPMIDLQLLPDRKREVQRLIAHDAEQPFDLMHDRLLRVAIVRLEPTESILLLTLHHLVADGWSVAVWVRELATIYAAVLIEQPVPLEPLPLQYADFAVWQRQELQGERLELLLAHWRRTLHNAPPLVTLPPDAPRPAMQTFRGRSVAFPVDLALTEQLKTLSQQAQVTLFMTLLAVFKVLLRSYTGQDDLVVGTPAANRDRPEIAGLIGYFVNVLVLRTELAGDLRFREVLARVYQSAIAAYSHQDLPFEKLVAAIQPERSLSYSPIFQVMFVLQNVPLPEVALPNLTLQAVEVEITTSKFDLTLAFRETATGLMGFIEYNTDLFQPETIDRFIQYYQRLLQQVVHDPEQPLSQLSLLTPAEQQQILSRNAPVAEYPLAGCIHHLFAAQVSRSPDAIAVVWQDHALTYHALNCRANQLAHWLQTQGVAPEVRVGVCLERSLDLIVAVLAVWKAGGVLVALDPMHPVERLEWVISDAQVAVLLTQGNVVASFPPCAAAIRCLDQAKDEIAQFETTNPLDRAGPENLVYILYTSGSTGRPKGVMIEHRSLVNAFFAWNDTYELATIASHLQMAQCTFDVFVGDLVRALGSGSKLVLCPSEWLLEPELLYELLQTQAIAAAEFTPTVVRLLLPYLGRSGQSLNRLCLLIVGADAFYWTDYQQLKTFCHPTTRILNSYGVTEATIDSTFFEPDPGSERHEGILPIGCPLPNTEIYILDAHLRPVPVGVLGNLYLGGAGLARGYLNQPELTQQRFIPHPFSLKPGDRLYKTGDLARYRSDGYIEYGGRSDRQVKLRGFRIELAEIEALLMHCPIVQEAAVILQSQPQDNQQLIAYVVLQTLTQDASVQLRAFLAARLPLYMVPAGFVILAEMPRTPSGKLDRQALPAIVAPTPAKQLIPPRTAIEQTLAAIWTEILAVPHLSVTDSFFDLGGHSLLATALVYRIRQALGVALPLRQLFATPTVAQLSQFLAAQGAEAALPEQSTVRLVPRNQPATIPVPLSLSQQYLWQMHQADRTGAGLNSSLMLQLNGPLSLTVLDQSLNEIVQRHEILRTVFSVVAGQPMQQVLPMLTVAALKIDLRSLLPELRRAAAIRHALKEGQRPFDLSMAPLIRVTVLQLSGTQHWVLMTLHHLITDGWTFRLLWQELDILMRAFGSGQPSPLPPITLHYADFALWQHQVYTEATIAQQLAYWRQHLVEVEPEPEPSPVNSSKQAEHHRLRLPDAGRPLLAFSRAQQVTSFVVLLTALKLVLHAQSGRREILVVATVGNRPLPETELMFGCFINDVIVRSQISLSQTGQALLQAVQAAVNEAIEHKEVPLQRVIEQTKRDRSLTLMASLTMTPSLQDEILPGWEAVSLQDCDWQQAVSPDAIPSELYTIGSTETTPLELYVEVSEAIQITLNYSLAEFTAMKIAQFCDNYQAILAALMAQPDASIATLINHLGN